MVWIWIDERGHQQRAAVDGQRDRAQHRVEDGDDRGGGHRPGLVPGQGEHRMTHRRC